MRLTSEQVSNLCLLADFMEGLVDPKFTMRWYLHECGSPACALGWATAVPELQTKGLTESYLGLGDHRIPTAERAEEFFGPDTHWKLFSTHLMGRIKTPQQWAAHCRAFLKENGYEVAKSDGFEKFMKKVTEPVDTEEFHPWRTA